MSNYSTLCCCIVDVNARNASSPETCCGQPVPDAGGGERCQGMALANEHSRM